MSNALAIATVTAALQQIVEAAARSEVPGAEVKIGRPDTAAANQGARINLYLYQVTPNAALRNADLPSRDSSGKLTARPQAALELHYLLSFCGEETNLTPERMMGAVIRDLHARPLLSRAVIERLVGDDGVLSESDLHQAVEQIRLTPVSMSLDDLSKLWSVFFQTPHARSLTYRASVVLIDAIEAGGSARPVLRRGKEDRGVETVLGPSPRLTELRIDDPATADWRPRLPTYHSIQLGWHLALRGSNLSGGLVTVELQHPLLKKAHRLAPVSVQAEEIVVVLPAQEGAAEAEKWPAGIYTVRAAVSTADGVRQSNVLPLPLAPHITEIMPKNPIHPVNGSVPLELHFSPEIPAKTEAVLLLADREICVQSGENATGSLTFPIDRAPLVKDAIVYLRVAGVESMPFVPSQEGHWPEFDEAQMVTIL